MRRVKRAGAEGEGRRRKFSHWWGCYATDGAAERAPTRQGLASGAVEQFRNPPIQEALLDIQVTLPPDVKLETLKKFHEGIEALVAITGEQPVPPQHAGNIEAMRQDWLQWGREHGYDC